MDLNQNLSPNFRLIEFVVSETARRLKIDNTPTEEIVENLKLLCENVLEPLRELLGKSIKIISGYRCLELNTAIGGSKNSQHMQGKAGDLRVEGYTVGELFKKIQSSNLQYDQLIEERFVPTNPNSGCLHISYNASKNRKKSIKIS